MPQPQFDAEHINKLQEFECLIVQHNTTAPNYYAGLPEWTEAYNQSDFAWAEKRLFGADDYEFFIGKILGLSENHCNTDTEELIERSLKQWIQQETAM